MKTNYVLIDYENVTPDNLDLLDQEWVRVLLFIGKNQTRIPTSLAISLQKWVRGCNTSRWRGREPEEDVNAVVEALFAEGFVVENDDRLEYACEKTDVSAVVETEQ